MRRRLVLIAEQTLLQNDGNVRIAQPVQPGQRILCGQPSLAADNQRIEAGADRCAGIRHGCKHLGIEAGADELGQQRLAPLNIVEPANRHIIHGAPRR